jgi:glutathione transport system substrate-binding protein
MAVAKSFYQGLYGSTRISNWCPVLAESHTVSKDGLTYTIKLQAGVKFHDGTDFNAEAVKANFDRVTNPENKLKRYNDVQPNIAKTEVVAANTVRSP